MHVIIGMSSMELKKPQTTNHISHYNSLGGGRRVVSVCHLRIQPIQPHHITRLGEAIIECLHDLLSHGQRNLILVASVV